MLNVEIDRIMNRSEVQARFAEIGTSYIGGTPEQAPSAQHLDATPERDTGVPSRAGLLRACAVASPQAGRVGGRKRGPAGDLTPQTRMGSASHRRACDRLHGRIPQAGPCSALRRSLLHAPARRRFWTQPGGLARVLAQGFVALLANIRDIVCVALRALSQNRASAARASFWNALYTP